MLDWFKMAVAAIKLAISNNPSFGVMSAVFAAGVVGAALLAAFGGRPEFALLAVAFVVAFMFVLLVFLAGGQSQAPSRSRVILADTLAWVFSFAMIVSIGLTISSYFACWPAPFGTHCTSRHVSIDAFELLDGKHLRKVSTGRFSLKSLYPKGTSEIVEYQSLDNLAIPWIVTVSGFRMDEGESVDLTLVLRYSTDGKKFVDYQEVSISHPSWWKGQPLVKELDVNRAPDGKWQSVLEFAKANGIQIRAGGFPILWVSTCFDRTDVEGGHGYLALTIIDNKSQTFDKSKARKIVFRPITGNIGENCPKVTSQG